MIGHLQTLAAIARHGTFAAAADRIGLTPSAVSVQMRKLEETLGVALFDRSGRNAVLNEAGRRALLHAEQILELFGQMASGVDDAALTGTLRAGAVMTELLGSVVNALPLFRQRFPKVELQLTPGASAELIGLVEQQRLDCAVIVRPAYPLEGVLHWRALRQEPFVLIAAADERSDDVPWLLAHRPFVRYDRRSHGGHLVDRFLRRKRYVLDEALETDSIEAIVLFVARGGGVAIIPRTPVLQSLRAQVREIELGVDTFYREIGLLERTDNPRAHLNGDFWMALKEVGGVAT
ncbi:LysR family transcriptional regulator [Xylophilus rhododendri]|uniref:LysR family transcriptional regulator n=1 Tax=Xylophilus rhododendri TaxID=2697032 RepID=A0A857J638_9BURK|nr:LysR family transcriptional regulator [Xylophilus rhododendri]QHI99454.1 LysR family transcriptional regulator [Xylophilus rhododendri]